MSDRLTLNVLEDDVRLVAFRRMLYGLKQTEPLKARRGDFEASRDLAPRGRNRGNIRQRIFDRELLLHYRVLCARRARHRGFVRIVCWRGPKQGLDCEAAGYDLALFAGLGRRQRRNERGSESRAA